MGSYLYTNSNVNGGLPIAIDSENVLKLKENTFGMHFMKIATALEKAGIDGVRVDWHAAGDGHYNALVLRKPGSLGDRLLKLIFEEITKTGSIPTVECVVAGAKYVQELEANSI